MEEIIKKRFHLEVTGACNLQCGYCYNSLFNRVEVMGNELSFSEKACLIEQALDLGCKIFIFSGGEPFLYGHLFNLIKLCPEDARVSVITNASLINPLTVAKLKEFKQLTEIKISWDGFSAHDKVRAGSGHKQVMEIITLIKRELPHCKIIINTMINRYSIGELLALYYKLRDFQIGHWRIDMPFNSGRCIENFQDLMDIDFEDIILVYRDLLKIYFTEEKPLILEIFNVYKSMINTEEYYEFDDDVHPCAYYNNTITVRPNGDLTFCPSLPFSIANWRDSKNLKVAIETAGRHEYFSVRLKNISACVNCRYLKICGGGCRADAVATKKDAYAPDPISCSIMPLIEKHIMPILPRAERKMYEKLVDQKKDFPLARTNVLEI